MAYNKRACPRPVTRGLFNVLYFFLSRLQSWYLVVLRRPLLFAVARKLTAGPLNEEMKKKSGYDINGGTPDAGLPNAKPQLLIAW